MLSFLTFPERHGNDRQAAHLAAQRLLVEPAVADVAASDFDSGWKEPRVLVKKDVVIGTTLYGAEEGFWPAQDVDYNWPA